MSKTVALVFFIWYNQYLNRRCVSMFLSSLLQYAVKFVLFAAVAVAGIFIGKALRSRKDAKTAAEQIQEEK